MELALLGGGVFAAGVILVADRTDAIVDALHSSDDPLTDFDADLDAESDAAEDSPESLDDV
ncbi:MAG: hypothetical protein ABEJ40_05990 [Haloarculaceae archaeon]